MGVGLVSRAPIDRTDVTPITKEMQTGRVWTCRANNESCTRRAPCRSCLGRRNRRSGMAKQRQAKKMAGIPDNRFRGADANEEMFLGTVRVEIKSGKQVAGVWSKYFAAETQSAASKAIGDGRPFLALFMPPNSTEGLFIGRLSKLRQITEALAEQLDDAS
jgi:hypothetical protein